MNKTAILTTIAIASIAVAFYAVQKNPQFSIFIVIAAAVILLSLAGIFKPK